MPIAFVQHTEASAQIPGSTGTTSAFGASTTTGNLIVVTIRWADFSSRSVSSVTDSAGNTYALVLTDTSSNPGLTLYYKENITGGASVTVSCALNGADSYAWIAADEYSGLLTASALDSSWSATGSGTTDLTVPSITTAQASELVFAVASQNNFATMSAGTDFALRDAAIVSAGGVEDYITSGTLSGYTAHFTSNISNQYTMLVAAFKGAGGGPPASPTYPQLERGIRGLGRGLAGGLARSFVRKDRIFIPAYATYDLQAAA